MSGGACGSPHLEPAEPDCSLRGEASHSGFRFRSVINLRFLFDTVATTIKPLRVRDVLASPSQFFVSIVDGGTGDNLLVSAQKTSASLLTLLEASCSHPFLCSTLIDVDGRHCFDGGFANPLPVQDAIDSGCTDLLVLLTQPLSYVERPPTRLEQWIFERVRGRASPRVREVGMNVHRRANGARDIALGRRRPGAPVNIATICPENDSYGVGRTTKRSDILKAAAVTSARQVLRAFNADDGRLVEVLRRFSD